MSSGQLPVSFPSAARCLRENDRGRQKKTNHPKKKKQWEDCWSQLAFGFSCAELVSA